MPIVTRKFSEVPVDGVFGDGRGRYWTKVALHQDEASGMFKYQVNAIPVTIKDGKKIESGRPVRFLDHTVVHVEIDEPVIPAS